MSYGENGYMLEHYRRACFPDILRCGGCHQYECVGAHAAATDPERGGSLRGRMGSARWEAMLLNGKVRM